MAHGLKLNPSRHPELVSGSMPQWLCQSGWIQFCRNGAAWVPDQRPAGSRDDDAPSPAKTIPLPCPTDFVMRAATGAPL